MVSSASSHAVTVSQSKSAKSRSSTRSFTFPADKAFWINLESAVSVYPGARDFPHFEIETSHDEKMLVNQRFMKEFVKGWEVGNPHMVDVHGGQSVSSKVFWGNDEQVMLERAERELQSNQNDLDTLRNDIMRFKKSLATGVPFVIPSVNKSGSDATLSSTQRSRRSQPSTSPPSVCSDLSSITPSVASSEPSPSLRSVRSARSSRSTVKDTSSKQHFPSAPAWDAPVWEESVVANRKTYTL